MRAPLVDEKRAKASSAHAAAVDGLVEHQRHRLLDHLQPSSASKMSS